MEKRMITHVVVLWVDKPFGENREKVLAGAKALAQIPGVLEFRCGLPLPSNRGVVDDSFSVALSMTFKNEAAANVYQTHPLHLEFLEKCYRPYVKRSVIYDWSGATS
jgi:hypothetical protein